jgi:hypothetical protein
VGFLVLNFKKTFFPAFACVFSLSVLFPFPFSSLSSAFKNGSLRKRNGKGSEDVSKQKRNKIKQYKPFPENSGVFR